jgi:hypothetical protein
MLRAYAQISFVEFVFMCCMLSIVYALLYNLRSQFSVYFFYLLLLPYIVFSP